MRAPPRAPRAVLDTNVIVSGLINAGGPPGAVLRAARERRFRLVTSPAVNEEVLEVISRPHLARYGLGNAAADIAFLLWEVAEVVAAPPPVAVSPDPDDDKFLAAAAAGHAQFIVTGDASGLLSLRRFRRIRIVTPERFGALIGRDRPMPAKPA